MPPLNDDPLNAYATRRDRWRSQRQIVERLFIRIGNWRLFLGLLELVLAWLAFGSRIVTPWVLLGPFAAFIGLVVWHGRVIRQRTAADRAIKFYESRLARVEDRWVGTGPAGNQFRNPDHVYADDLDVFGKGSLFELAATARISAGEQTLANWLLAPAFREHVLSRQEGVRELSTRLDLREEISLLGEDVRGEIHVEALQTWGSMPPVHFAPGSRLLAAALAILGPATLLLYLAGKLPLWPFFAVVGCDALFRWSYRERVAQVTGTLGTPAQGLRLLSLLLQRLEQEQFQSPHLNDLRARLDVSGQAASKRIARLESLIDWLDSSDHLLIRIIGPVLLWREQLTMAVEAWRRETGSHIGPWVQSVAEFEALSSLAALAFEHPQWCFPTLVDTVEPLFEAEALQHPLLSPVRSVANDIALNGALRLLIVSGSNMSGKSTLLRAVGLNSVLAWAGAPVAARKLRISALQPGASIGVTDSLQDNRSRFMAEILRLREILDLTKPDLTKLDLTKAERPVLFLLDELLSGTNSHDRRIGAAGIMHKLVESGAIGLITTHDLALAQIEHDVGEQAANVHFEDHMLEGRIEFDYRLRPGVVTRSNALELMRAVGLEL